jgi:hypothetical protein
MAFRFRLKYHPEESKSQIEEQKAFVDKRLAIFISLLEAGHIEQTNLDYENAANVIRLMDTGKAFPRWNFFMYDSIVVQYALSCNQAGGWIR